MKQLFGTSDLEAEVFTQEELSEDDSLQTEDDSAEAVNEFEEAAEELAAFERLEKLSEREMERLPALELSIELEDGSTETYEVATVFACGEKEYIGLFPKSDTEGTLSIMQLTHDEDDEIKLLPVAEEEWQAVQDKFAELYTEEPV